MTVEEILLEDNVVSSINNHLEYLVKEIPELKNMFNFDQHHPHHHLDVWKHTMLALAYSNKDLSVRMALLLHDIGKPFCFQDEQINENEFIRHFHGHAELSAKMAKKILKRIGYDKEFIKDVVSLIELHDTEITLDDIKEKPDFTKKRLHVQECDSKAHNPDYQEKRLAYVEEIKNLIGENTMDKKTLREQYKTIRKDIPNKDKKSKKILEALINNPLFQEAKVIAFYNSFKDEVDTKELMAVAKNMGKTILLPRTLSYDLIFFEINKDTKFKKSEFGIDEPVGGKVYSLEMVDLVIVPGLAFDKEGNRLGYGGGYYDRYLEFTKLPSIGICFQEQISDTLLPTTEQDMKVDMVQTDKELYYGTKNVQLSKRKK